MHRDRADLLIGLDPTALEPAELNAVHRHVDDLRPLVAPVQTGLRTVAVADEWAFVRHGVEAHLRRVGARITASAPTFHDLGEGLRRDTATTPDLAVVGTLPDITTLAARTPLHRARRARDRARRTPVTATRARPLGRRRTRRHRPQRTAVGAHRCAVRGGDRWALSGCGTSLRSGESGRTVRCRAARESHRAVNGTCCANWPPDPPTTRSARACTSVPRP